MLNRFGFRNASLLHSPIFIPFPQIFFPFPQCRAKQQSPLNLEKLEKLLLHLVVLLALRSSLKKFPPQRRQSLGQRKQIKSRLTKKKNPNLGERNAKQRMKHQMAMRKIQQRQPRKKCDFSFSCGTSISETFDVRSYRLNLHQRLRHPLPSQRRKLPPSPPNPFLRQLPNQHPSQHPKRSQPLGLLPLNLLQEQDLGNLRRRFVLFLLLILLGDVWAFVLSFYHTLIFIMRLTTYFYSG